MGRSEDAGYWDSISISEASRIMGIAPSSLRYYESEGLLTPARIEGSGYRTYSVDSLTELGDVLLYRSIGVPVKSIPALMNSPVENTMSAIDTAIQNTTRQIQELSQTLDRLSMFNQRVRRYYMARIQGSAVVDRPDIDALYSFGMKDENSLRAYLAEAATNYGVLIEDANRPNAYIDCAPSPTQVQHSEKLWDAAAHPGRYYQCLMRTDYCQAQHNDVADHVRAMERLGLRAGALVSQFLTFDYSPEDEKRYDYYLAWIEILEEEG